MAISRFNVTSSLQVSLVEEGGLFQTILSYAKYAVTMESVLIKPADDVNPESDSMMKLVCHAQWYVIARLRRHCDFRGSPRARCSLYLAVALSCFAVCEPGRPSKTKHLIEVFIIS